MGKLTKQGIDRLLKSPANVKLINGCYNVVTAKAVFSKYSLELKVEVTHPALEWQCGPKHDVSLTYWTGYSGTEIDIPDSLSEKINVMKTFGKMNDERAIAMAKENASSFLKMWEELGMTSD